jgi:hypothetical protein
LSKTLPPIEDMLILANEFGNLFVRKIELINDEINKLDVNPVTVDHRLPPKCRLIPFLCGRKTKCSFIIILEFIRRNISFACAIRRMKYARIYN